MRSGNTVTWRVTTLPASALAIEPAADPNRVAHVWLSAPAGTRAALSDELGSVDTVSVARGGARAIVPELSGTLRAASRNFAATATLRDSLVLRPVLVLGQAGWEAKFVVAALEEHGWSVDARLSVAPSGDVRQGAQRVVIDTAQYAAVVAIDSVAARYSDQIVRYVRAGGGLIAHGEAARLSALAPVLPGTVTGAASLPAVFTSEPARASPRAALALAALGRLKPGAVALESRSSPNGEEIAAAAWRVNNGRVLQLGYYNTWRWRLASSDDNAVAAHRDWWASLVSGVAYAPRVALAKNDIVEPTPLASLVESLGPAQGQGQLAATIFDHPRLTSALFVVLLTALVLEWTLRRFRGLR
jgi:hypothetical protein